MQSFILWYKLSQGRALGNSEQQQQKKIPTGFQISLIPIKTSRLNDRQNRTVLIIILMNFNELNGEKNVIFDYYWKCSHLYDPTGDQLNRDVSLRIFPIQLYDSMKKER